MSRIGRKPIPIPHGVKVAVQGQKVNVEGPKGKLSVDVRPEILEAQSHYMIGHRGKEFEVLFASLQSKLKQAFLTQNRVYVLGSSGTGFWEAACRNGIRDDQKVLHLVGGAFS